jgi:LysM repeat protein
MAQILRLFSLATIIALVLSACTFPPENVVPPQPVQPSIPIIVLTVNANISVPFDAVSKVINYTYLIKNTGAQSLPGPVSVVDNKRIPACPEVTTVGNADGNLDTNEEVTCTGTYAITQADLDAGSVTNSVMASVGGTNSNPISFTVNMTQNRVLTLSKAANPTTYTQLGQVITYTYVILNGGNVTLQGPFSIADDKATANCTQPEDGLLSPNEQMSCTASYSIVQDNLNAASVSNNATASNGTITSAPVTTTINKTGSTGSVPSPGTNYQHTVVKGEWLWQIARCYGADPRAVINANPQLSNPSRISSDITVTVPNVGSNGTIYGSPCIHIHTVQSGDTWASIAQLYNADSALIQKVNPAGLTPGSTIRVPVGPYDYP